MAKKVETNTPDYLLVKAVLLVAQRLELLIEEVKSLRESLTNDSHQEEVN